MMNAKERLSSSVVHVIQLRKSSENISYAQKNVPTLETRASGYIWLLVSHVWNFPSLFLHF